MKLNVALSALQELKSQISLSHSVVNLAVFGSTAREDAHESSDVDILVSFAPGVHHGLSFFSLQNLIATKLGEAVDLVTIEEIHPSMRKIVLSEARYV